MYFPRFPLVRALLPALLASALACAPEASDATEVTHDENTSAAVSFNVMGPLVIGDPRAPHGGESSAQWDRVRDHLRQVKALGADSVSTDVWWGIVEGEGDQRFAWDYYDRLSDEILEAGLDWVPILSFHKCGGNVGDECDVPIPGWIGEKYRSRGAVGDAEDVFYRSAQGNTSHEVLSAWATPIVVDEYRELMVEFQAHFAAKARRIKEVNVSLGPAGELRFPSYNAHDRGAGFPSRGELQSHSRLAVESFRRSVLEKYGSAQGVGEAWGAPITSVEDIAPPADAAMFFNRNDPFTAYGKDFIGWYQRSLLAHGRALLGAAIAVFDEDGAPFSGIDIGAKVPGIHWRIGTDRYAEMTAGLIRSEDAATWFDESKGMGYGPIVDLFAATGRLPRAPRVVLHFTCLEMDDGEHGAEAASRAKSLVFWVGKHATSRSVPVKGENALAGTLASPRAWTNMANALTFGGYRGLTILRMQNVVEDDNARRGFESIVKHFRR